MNTKSPSPLPQFGKKLPSAPRTSALTKCWERLGLKRGGIVLVHVAFRKLKPWAGTPSQLIASLCEWIGSQGTLVLPAWGEDDDAPFKAEKTPVATDLGAVAQYFWRLSGVERSSHCFAFAAKGPFAKEIVSDSLPLPPHTLLSPVGRVYNLGGQVLLLGVGHEANTTLHLAEWMAEVPYRVPKYFTHRENHCNLRVDYLENDHCCQRFTLADEWLRAEKMQQETFLGKAPLRLFHSQDLLRLSCPRLKENPLLFLHPPFSECQECSQAHASIPPP